MSFLNVVIYSTCYLPSWPWAMGFLAFHPPLKAVSSNYLHPCNKVFSCSKTKIISMVKKCKEERRSSLKVYKLNYFWMNIMYTNNCKIVYHFWVKLPGQGYGLFTFISYHFLSNNPFHSAFSMFLYNWNFLSMPCYMGSNARDFLAFFISPLQLLSIYTGTWMSLFRPWPFPYSWIFWYLKEDMKIFSH